MNRLLFLLVALACFGNVQAERKLHSDVISYLIKKPYIAEPNDLLSLSGLRFFSIGLTEAQLQSVFHATAKPVSFGARPDTIIRGHWNFGGIQVIELTSAHEWNEKQLQEFCLRFGGYVKWAQRMNDPGWYARARGWQYDYNFSVQSDAKPLAILLDNMITRLPATQINEIKAANVHLLDWSSTQQDFGKQIKHLLITRAHSAEIARVKQQAYTECMKRSIQTQALAEDYMRRSTNSERDEAYARGVQDTQHERQRVVRVEVPVERECPENVCDCPYVEDMCELILDVITQTPMSDPVLNVKSGQSYSRQSITTWVREKGTDPITRDPTTLQDLIPNRYLNDIVLKLRNHCQ